MPKFVSYSKFLVITYAFLIIPTSSYAQKAPYTIIENHDKNICTDFLDVLNLPQNADYLATEDEYQQMSFAGIQGRIRNWYPPYIPKEGSNFHWPEYLYVDEEEEAILGGRIAHSEHNGFKYKDDFDFVKSIINIDNDADNEIVYQQMGGDFQILFMEAGWMGTVLNGRYVWDEHRMLLLYKGKPILIAASVDRLAPVLLYSFRTITNDRENPLKLICEIGRK